MNGRYNQDAPMFGLFTPFCQKGLLFLDTEELTPSTTPSALLA